MHHTFLGLNLSTLRTDLPVLGLLLVVIPLLCALLVRFFRLWAEYSSAPKAQDQRILSGRLGSDGLPAFFDLDYHDSDDLTPTANQFGSESHPVTGAKGAGPRRAA